MSTPPDEQPDPPETPEQPITIGGRYRLDERIGAGAMGAVWRATDELLNRTVAVKELIAAAVPPSTAGYDTLEESRQRILREGRIGARLQHPHVISMFDVVVHDDRPWLVMEYLPSKSLAALLKEKGTLEPREAAEVGRQVADGLAAAHVAGVVHRDVKPGNVLIGEDGRVKLTDFGVSRAVDDVQLTRTGLIAGTPAFLAPEVARGGQPTSASDIFALGATLYAAVEGRPPFGLDDNAYALLHKVATGVIHPPEHAGPLTAMLMRLLALEPGDRPTAAQAREGLAAVAAGRPAPGVVAGPAATTVVVGAEAPPTRTDLVSRPSGPPPAGSGGRRRVSPVLLAVLGVVLLLVGTVVAVVLVQSGGGNEEPAPPPPVAQPTTPPGEAPATTPEPAPTTARAPEPTTAPPTTAAPSPTQEPTSEAPPAEPPPSDADAVAFVQNYYGLLPGNTDAAWELLSPQAQAQSGGRSGFDDFYGGMSDVTITDARSAGDGVVQATVVFTRSDGSTSREPYSFVVSEGVIQSFSRL
ncbi:MAG TPA: protein kinase [Pseudonocardia sp.]|nr:protein kinase [Pseudonocardia sp.]